MKKNILLVIDMLNDFIRNDGALYVKGSERIIPNIKKLIDHAHENNMTVIFANDAHDEDDEEFKTWPKHCVKGKYGARVIHELTPSEKDLVFEKKKLSILSSEKFEQYLLDLKKSGEENIDVYITGVATDYCVRAAALSINEFAWENDSLIGDIIVIRDCIMGVDMNIGDTIKAVAEMIEDAEVMFLSSEEAIYEITRNSKDN